MVPLCPYLAALTLAASVCVGSASTNLADWIKAQAAVRTWAADFTQTRTLKALVQPLKSEGRVWFAAPNRFRWELGQPAQTIAVRTTNALLLIYARLKRVERYALGEDPAGAEKGMLSLLEAGFPRSQAELEGQFRILAVNERNGQAEVLLQPKSSQARRWVQQIVVAFDTRTYTLAATELRFADNSVLRNDFSNPRLNVPVEEALFSPPIPPDFTTVEPLKNSSKATR